VNYSGIACQGFFLFWTYGVLRKHSRQNYDNSQGPYRSKAPRCQFIDSSYSVAIKAHTRERAMINTAPPMMSRIKAVTLAVALAVALGGQLPMPP
jgi:hypothetical protein